jgi:hypothetical protein
LNISTWQIFLTQLIGPDGDSTTFQAITYVASTGLLAALAIEGLVAPTKAG